MARQSCDLATLGTLCKGTCGQLCHYFPWDARLDADQLENDLRWNLQRPQVIESQARSALYMRCGLYWNLQGLQPAQTMLVRCSCLRTCRWPAAC